MLLFLVRTRRYVAVSRGSRLATLQLMGAEISDSRVYEIMNMNMSILMPKGSTEFVEGFEDLVRTQTGMLLPNPVLFFCQFEEMWKPYAPEMKP